MRPVIPPPPRKPGGSPPRTPKIPAPPVVPELDKLTREMNMLRGEMRTSFAALERRVQGTAEGIERHPSQPPRGYTLPMTPTGRVLLDEVQGELDRLRRERNEAAKRAADEKEARKEAALLSDIKLRKWTSTLGVLIALAGLLGGLASHFLGKTTETTMVNSPRKEPAP